MIKFLILLISFCSDDDESSTGNWGGFEADIVFCQLPWHFSIALSCFCAIGMINNSILQSFCQTRRMLLLFSSPWCTTDKGFEPPIAKSNVEKENKRKLTLKFAASPCLTPAVCFTFNSVMLDDCFSAILARLTLLLVSKWREFSMREQMHFQLGKKINCSLHLHRLF